MRVVHFTEAYQEDIPKIIKPDKAANYIRAYLSRQPNSHQTIFGVERMLWDAGVPYYQGQHQSSMAMNTIAQRLELGDFFLLDSRENAFDGIQFFGDISPFESPLLRNRIKRLAARTKRENKEEAESIADIALNTAYFIGGVTKFVGNTVTGTVEAIIEAPTEIAYNALYAVVDTAYYPIDYVARPLGLGLGAVERTVARADSVLSDLTDFAGSVSENWAEGDWQALGSNAAAVLVEASPRALLKPSLADGVKKIDDVARANITNEIKVVKNAVREVSEKYGSNTAVWKLDEQGRPISVEAKLDSTYSLERSRAEKKLQGEVGGSARLSDDDGGHLIGHRFMSDQGEKNLFPQNANFNRGSYKKMENEWADWTAEGYEVKLKVSLEPPNTARPTDIISEYEVIDPKTGDVIYEKEHRFSNQNGQDFERISKKNMKMFRG